ncbi:aldehyde dehydrogenase family protein [Solicola sp. PLA-1-18]|uniref:aldehyde dehydrogenase family protein n=1 Tax=Solicola sp. PLA-1-18 TaxID=3380532 RepID=UPI003B7A2615
MTVTDSFTPPAVDHLTGGAASSNFRDHVDPGRLDTVASRVATGTAADVDRAVQRAHQAFLSWRSTPVSERVAVIMKAADIVQGSAEELAPLLVREHGGVLWEATTDFMLGTGVLQHTASLAESFFEAVQHDDETSFISIEKVPRGVVGAIVPWNMPVVLTMMKLAPALATGNTIVLKPSPFAPAALTMLLERMSAELPEGVVNVVLGDTEVGEALTSHPLIRKVGFTGGTATARHVMSSAAQSIKNVTLELGGNDAAVVLDDADLDSTLEGMLPGIFTRTGQICFAVKRVYVPRASYDTFVDALCDRVGQYKVGHGLDPEASFGPLNNKAQFDRVSELIAAAKDSPSKVIELGHKLDADQWDNGYYVLPHVVRDVEHDALITSCEQFGPIIPVVAYDSEEQAIAWANDSEYGLCSSVWGTDTDHALTVARQIEAGSTFVNSHSFASLDLRMPFGGIKQSGIGREFGAAGMSEYVEEHAIRVVK